MADLGRKKQVDLTKMDPGQVKVIEAEIDKKVTKIINEAETQLKFLNTYGIGYKLVVGLAKLGEEENQIEKLIGCKIYKKRKK